LDTDFNPSPLVPTSSSVRRSLVQNDGKVVLGGTFASINGYTRHNIARLNNDGSLDLTFNSTVAATIYPLSMALQPDGKILVAGGIINGGNNDVVFRLNSDGGLDNTFNQVAAVRFAYNVDAMALQPDAKIVIGGDFTAINGTNIHGIARLNGDNSPATDLQFLNANRYFGTYLGGTVSNTYRVEWTTDLNTLSLWTPLFNLTLQTNPQFILDPTPISGSQRFYRAVGLPSP
jgi:uncharacterized delta-60 repeat protein